MARVPVWRGAVNEAGTHLILSAAERDQRRAFLRSLAGKTLDIVFKVHRSQRSIDQNAWEWGVAIPILAEHLGYDLDEHEALHYALVDECFGRSWDERLKRDMPNVRSSKLNTEQYSKYMEWLVRWAAREHGCVIPLPNESEAA